MPKEYWGETEIRLMATAGLRMLDLGVQAQILESCRKFLRVSRFKFQDDWASVITGMVFVELILLDMIYDDVGDHYMQLFNLT